MVTEILGTILASVFCFSGIGLLVWFVIYTTKSEYAKRVKELNSELDNLKIVNTNLAKYNEDLVSQFKKNNK